MAEDISLNWCEAKPDKGPAPTCGGSVLNVKPDAVNPTSSATSYGVTT
jgi:hypothetical protein